MIGRDKLTARQISNSPCQLENAMIGSRREVQLLHRRLHEFFSGRLNFAKGAYLGWPHFGIAGDFCAFETLQLAFAGRLHPLPNGFRVLDLPFISQFLIIHAGNLDMDINTIEQRATDAFLVARDSSGGASAFFNRVGVKTAWTSVRIAVVSGSREKRGTCPFVRCFCSDSS